ncbi:hypothetical protein [Streptomyces pseudogriseolus]|uniref:hypothetical protein n=1 Tax=Streptomyces pseudogriseolus TaxID=36817 RepID=UPI003FA25570
MTSRARGARGPLLDSGDVPGAPRLLWQAGTAPLTEGALEQLREGAPGQVLHEHASCWTGPPRSRRTV